MAHLDAERDHVLDADGVRGRGLTSHLHFASMNRMSLFITCPVESVERATAFYTALG